MAKFELNIYGKNDKIVKKYETDFVRWGVFMQALEVAETLKEKSAAKQFETINNFIKKIFPDLTDADLENADANDVMNTFKQLISKTNQIGGSSKNAAGAE